MHAHSAVVFATAAKQVAQSKVKLRGVGVFLHRLDESVYRRVLLFIEQVIQAFEVGFGRAAVVDAQLAQVEARGKPAEHKGQRQAQQKPGCIQLHQAAPSGVREGLC